MESVFPIDVILYWGGKIISGPKGLAYDLSPSGFLALEKDCTYNALVEQVSREMNVEKRSKKLKFTYRCPAIIGPSGTEFIAMPIFDNRTVESMIRKVVRNPMVTTVELYVETEDVGDVEPRITEASAQCAQAQGSSELQATPMGMDLDVQSCDPGPSALVDFNSLFQGDSVEEMAIKESPTCASKGTPNNLSPSNSDEEIDFETGELDGCGDEDDELDKGHLIAADSQAAAQRIHEAPAPCFTSVDLGAYGGQSCFQPLPKGQLWAPVQHELVRGSKFKDKAELKKAMQLHCIGTQKQYQVVASKSHAWILRCKLHKEKGCIWRMRACKRKNNGMWEITKLNGPHTCYYPDKVHDHHQLDAAFVANVISDIVRAKPELGISAIIDFIQEKYHYQISYKKAWYAKQKAMSMIFGDWEESYKELPKFLAAVEQYNPGTIIRWMHISTDVPDEVIFDKVFWSFKPLIDGFRHCRPLISIDATFLCGKYKGALLNATGVDGNNQNFPLAFAIVNEESYETWSWFLYHLRRQVVPNREGICLISGMHNEILGAVASNDVGFSEPNAYHRFCLRDVCRDFNSNFKDANLKELVWRAGSVHQVHMFNIVMEEIRKLNPKAAEYLNTIPLEKWTIAHDGGRRYGMRTTNISEVFNGVLKGARHYPVKTCVELIFYRLVNYFDMRRCVNTDVISSNWRLTPVAIERLERYRDKIEGFELKSIDQLRGIFSVITRSRKVQAVQLIDRSCSCGKWAIYGIPCSHALAVVAHTQRDIHAFVDDCYSIDAYQCTWSTHFQPIQHRDNWAMPSGPVVRHNPVMLRSKGRPQSTRIRNEMMESREGPLTPMKCGICSQPGHNRRKCPMRSPNAEPSGQQSQS